MTRQRGHNALGLVRLLKNHHFFLFLTNNSDPGPASEQPGEVALPPGGTHFLPGPGERGPVAISQAAAL